MFPGWGFLLSHDLKMTNGRWDFPVNDLAFGASPVCLHRVSGATCNYTFGICIMQSRGAFDAEARQGTAPTTGRSHPTRFRDVRRFSNLSELTRIILPSAQIREISG